MAHVTFIHGMANKPPHDALLGFWRRSLAESDGLDLGTDNVSSSMVYWADVMYPEALKEATDERASDESTVESMSPGSADLGLERMDAAEKAWVATLALKMAVPLAAEAVVEAVPSPVRQQLERIPLPWPVKERLMRRLLRDVHHYLFNVDFTPRPGTTYRVQDEIRARMLRALQEGARKPGPHVVVSHSMGTVIAYDCLKRVAGVPVVDGFMTIGSPLGLDEIQDKLRPEWSRDDGFPHEKVRGGWVNVYDHLDPVAGFDPAFGNDYRRGGKTVVDDLNEQNSGSWRHDIAKYLRGARLREKFRGLLGLG
jgi:hypothetical protein